MTTAHLGLLRVDFSRLLHWNGLLYWNETAVQQGYRGKLQTESIFFGFSTLRCFLAYSTEMKLMQGSRWRVERSGSAFTAAWFA